jgi:subtilisin family serine protease
MRSLMTGRVTLSGRRLTKAILRPRTRNRGNTAHAEVDQKNACRDERHYTPRAEREMATKTIESGVVAFDLAALGGNKMARIVTVFIAVFISAAGSSVSAQPAELARYIVVLNPGAGASASVAADVARANGGRVGFVYVNALQGFSIVVPPQAVPAIERDPRVAYVESDDPVELFAQTLPTGLDRTFMPASSTAGIAALAIDGADDYRVDVDVAVIDTGIDYQHDDLNVAGGTNCTYLSGSGPLWARSAYCVDGEGDDDHYHGTHVAGTIGALDNGLGVVGVAPGARLWSVKVLDGSGSGYESNIVAGIDWVAAHAQTLEVANMSLGGSGRSQAEQDAIDTAVAAGVVFVVAAGNSDADAANYSPAGLANVVTVSALADFDGKSGGTASATCRSDVDDTLADFSNWGSAVEIAAPGVCILSTYPLERGGYGTISGTSMASPHVAGAAALLASGANGPNTKNDVDVLVNTLTNSGNLAWSDDSGDGIKEPLLEITNYTPALIAAPTGNANSPPIASFTYLCDGLSCSFDGGGTIDGDGSISGYVWDFGDGGSATGVTPAHTFSSDGNYAVTLTVTDDDGATDWDSRVVQVSSDPSPAGIVLTASGYKVRGMQRVDLSWSGAASADVDVHRDAALIATTANDGAYTDNINRKGGGSYGYRVCEHATSTCSATVIVVF